MVRLNRLLVWLALLAGLLVLGRSLEMNSGELHDHYGQEQLDLAHADPVSTRLPIPHRQAIVPTQTVVRQPRVKSAGRWAGIVRPVFYDEPPPSCRRFRRLCVLQI